MANDPTDMVTISNPNTSEERDVPRGALKFFVNSEQPWVEVSAKTAKSANTSKEN